MNSNSRRPVVSKISLGLAFGLAIVDYAMMFSQLRDEDAIVWIIGLAFSCWFGLPLFILGQLRVFWRFPVTHWVLLLFGCVLQAILLYEIYVNPDGSTGGLGALFAPLLLLLMYGFVAFAFAGERKRNDGGNRQH